MELSDGIRKIGFHGWYERQLLESHCYLVSAFLCLILVMAILEGFSFRAPGAEPLLRIAAMFAGTVVGAGSVGRYFRLLSLASRAAERSVCRNCSAYGMLEVNAAGAPSARTDDAAAPAPVPVRCRKCGHEWVIQ